MLYLIHPIYESTFDDLTSSHKYRKKSDQALHFFPSSSSSSFF
ncbi:hypothetical protein [Candidatus Nitrosocosmicus franklandus]|nr:hypothetical protein [Candidatus Nitrosocosmicus franklandus]